MTAQRIDGDPIGTTYLAPDGSFYRISHYETPFEAHGLGAEYEEPVYHYWSPKGGAANGLTTVPEGSVRVVLPTPQRPAVGSLFVSPDGTAYRLRNYSVDLNAEPFTGEKTIPHYVVALPGGGMTNTAALPDDARLVWAPEPEANR